MTFTLGDVIVADIEIPDGVVGDTAFPGDAMPGIAAPGDDLVVIGLKIHKERL